LLQYPDARFDMVRPGIITYGLEAFPGSFEKLRVEPVMSLVSRITFIKDVPAGFRVSYGGTFVTSRPSHLATVPVGYSYGYRRNLSNKGRAIVNGVHVPIAGRICMDQTVFDVTEAGDVHVGDQITLIGREGDARVAVEEHASIGGTINYEIVTGIPCNVPRILLPSA
jgi:alanine racemase